MCLSGLGPSVAERKHTHTCPYWFLAGKTWFLSSFFFLSPFFSPSMLVFHHGWGKEIRGRLHVVFVNMISKLASLSVARTGGCLYAGLQGTKEAPKDKRTRSLLSALGQWGKVLPKWWQIRMAGLESYPCNCVLYVLVGKEPGRFRINYYCKRKHREMYDKDLNIAL